MQLRRAIQEDQVGLVALIDGVYREYGDRICLENYDGDLLDLAGYYFARGGDFVVLDDAGTIRGAHAALPLAEQPGVCTFRRLYLETGLRGGGWGRQLMEWALQWAKANGFRRVEFWSDTRFARAHAFFCRLGFAPDGRVRHLTDGAMPYSEFFFFKELE